MATLEPLVYGRVVGRLMAIVADGDDSDDLPDAVPMAGTVTFTPKVSKVLVNTAVPVPVTAFPTQVVATVDAEGYVTWRGQRHVRLLAPSPALNPSRWFYTVTLALKLDNRAVVTTPFDIDVPPYDPQDADTIVDLTTASPVPTNPGAGVGIVRGPKGDSLRSIDVATGNVLVFTYDTEAGVESTEVSLPSTGGGGGGLQLIPDPDDSDYLMIG